MSMPRLLLRVVPAFALLLSNAAVAKEKTGEDALGPALCKVFESGTRGYSLRCSKRVDPSRGENTRLHATYRIGDGEPRQAEVFGDASSWMVHIAHRVSPGDTVRVGLAYSFTPTESVKQALREELRKFDLALVKDIEQALLLHKGAWKARFSVDPKESQFELLKSSRLADDTPTIPALLAELGFEKDSTTGRWAPTELTLSRLNLRAVQDATSGVLDPEEVELAVEESRQCLGVLGEGALGTTPRALTDLATRCLVKAESTAPPPDGVAPDGGAGPKKNACQALFGVPLTKLQAPGWPASGKAIEEVFKDLGTAQVSGHNQKCDEKTLKALSASGHLLTLARHLVALAPAEAAHRERVEKLAAVIVVTAEWVDGKEDILEAEAERRGYSLSSGAVYLTRLDDLVYPVAVSVCPFGCLRGDEQFWHGGLKLDRVLRSFSAEIGVAALTADNHGDARRRGGPGFLLGASWQVLAPFKLSGGTLFFENQESRGWQFDGFVGVTLDAAKAIEMMGLLGVTVPVQLTNIGSQPAPATSTR
ncbi:hypothetical protein [Comamonas sp. JC664]|uniref:hypothetical protein n=1 Tax=Comamonas sp. JC664 TaxID=2801917 RepID=UPI00174E0D84|nr:hypothetical protein [Comamonas sp. JC664]MBL0699226.1 hypothetical protein [Comamonas sp. JC664]GHH02124.1 hypothetical protein GCM10012319_70390 [Comamonas sp. KCTC 72670]